MASMFFLQLLNFFAQKYPGGNFHETFLKNCPLEFVLLSDRYEEWVNMA